MTTRESPSKRDVPEKNDTPTKKLEIVAERIAALRIRITPILRKEKSVSKVDQFYALALLDDLDKILMGLKTTSTLNAQRLK